jgi:hypothetical protein
MAPVCRFPADIAIFVPSTDGKPDYFRNMGQTASSFENFFARQYSAEAIAPKSFPPDGRFWTTNPPCFHFRTGLFVSNKKNKAISW